MNLEEVLPDLKYESRAPYFDIVIGFLERFVKKYDGNATKFPMQIKHVKNEMGILSNDRSATIFISNRFHSLEEIGLLTRTGVGRYKITDNGSDLLHQLFE